MFKARNGQMPDDVTAVMNFFYIKFMFNRDGWLS